MAATLVTNIRRIIGTAAEIAALTLTDYPVGSTFFESDTGILKVLNAAGALVNAPGETVSLSGSKAEISSTQYTIAAGATQTITRANGASGIKVFCESGSIRVRTDGQTCTAATGEPMGAGFFETYDVASVSIYAVSTAVVTGVSR